MKNFEFEYEGKKYWYSRSMTVVAAIYRYEKGNAYVLASRRGDNVPDFKGHWCMPCGYLDFDETLKEAAAREVFEETGFVIKPNRFELFYLNDDPKEDTIQNITARFKAFVVNPQFHNLTARYSEKEVDYVKWVDIKYIDNYEWAFNHYDIIKEYIK